MGSFNIDWFSTIWFYPSKLSSFVWMFNPLHYILFGVPLLFLLRYLFQFKRKQNFEVALEKKDLRNNPMTYLRFLPDILLAGTFIMLILALARPQTTSEVVEQWTEGIDIIMIVDISKSMDLQDFRPNRLEAAKKTCINFVNGRKSDRIGLVVFSGDAFSMAPLTTDYDLLKQYINSIDFNLIQTSGTAIGSALAAGLNRMEESKNRSKVMILMSDGDNNAGEIDPIPAAKLAHAHGIKIYSIAMGRDGKVPYGKDIFGRTRYVDNVFDETTLRKVAEIGEGKFFRVPNNKSLDEVFNLIDKYEKAEIKENRFTNTQDYYHIYLKWGALFLLLWLLSKSTFLTNLLLD